MCYQFTTKVVRVKILRGQQYTGFMGFQRGYISIDKCGRCAALQGLSSNSPGAAPGANFFEFEE
jgi:hypothetical protein